MFAFDNGIKHSVASATRRAFNAPYSVYAMLGLCFTLVMYKDINIKPFTEMAYYTVTFRAD